MSVPRPEPPGQSPPARAALSPRELAVYALSRSQEVTAAVAAPLTSELRWPEIAKQRARIGDVAQQFRIAHLDAGAGARCRDHIEALYLGLLALGTALQLRDHWPAGHAGQFWRPEIIRAVGSLVLVCCVATAESAVAARAWLGELSEGGTP